MASSGGDLLADPTRHLISMIQPPYRARTPNEGARYHEPTQTQNPRDPPAHGQGLSRKRNKGNNGAARAWFHQEPPRPLSSRATASVRGGNSSESNSFPSPHPAPLNSTLCCSRPVIAHPTSRSRSPPPHPAAPGINAAKQRRAGLGLNLLLTELRVTAPCTFPTQLVLPCTSVTALMQAAPGSRVKGRRAPRLVKVTLPVCGGWFKHTESFYATSASSITYIFATFSPLKVFKMLQNE